MVLIPENEVGCSAAGYPFPEGTYAYVDSQTGYADRPLSITAVQNYTLCARENGEYVHHTHITFSAYFEP